MGEMRELLKGMAEEMPFISVEMPVPMFMAILGIINGLEQDMVDGTVDEERDLEEEPYSVGSGNDLIDEDLSLEDSLQLLLLLMYARAYIVETLFKDRFVSEEEHVYHGMEGFFEAADEYLNIFEDTEEEGAFKC